MKRKKSHERFKESKELKKLNYLFRKIALERGKESAERIFKILEKWQENGLILAWGEYKRGGYHDRFLHQDGWLLTLSGDFINFQIKSSFMGAKKHLEKYPEIPVIVSCPDLRKLEEEMMNIFARYLFSS